MTPAPPYAAVAVWRPGQDKPSLVSNAKKQVIIWDTLEFVKHWLPLFSGGRLVTWSQDEETVFFSPFDPKGYSRACAVTPYDVYNVPAGWPIASETPLLGWKYHQHVAEYLKETEAEKQAAEAAERASRMANNPAAYRRVIVGRGR